MYELSKEIKQHIAEINCNIAENEKIRQREIKREFFWWRIKAFFLGIKV